MPYPFCSKTLARFRASDSEEYTSGFALMLIPEFGMSFCQGATRQWKAVDFDLIQFRHWIVSDQLHSIEHGSETAIAPDAVDAEREKAHAGAGAFMSDNDKGEDVPPELVTLHRYFIWANRMRTHFDEILAREQCPFEGVAFIESFLYMSYWYGGLYVVIEGWKALNLSDDIINELLDSRNVKLLKRYRNGVFHFQHDYHDRRFHEFMSQAQLPRF